MAAERIRSVIVTRPVGRGRGLVRALAARGFAVASLPGSTLAAPEDPHAARTGLDAVRVADVAIFVSPAAVGAAFRLQPALAFGRRTQLLAPGPGTRAALARRGLDARCPATRFDSEGLLALPPLIRPAGQHIVILGAPGGRDLLARTLAARGARVERVAVYARRAARLDLRHLERLDALAAPIASLWSSAEAIANVLDQLPADRQTRIARALAVASSERIASALRARGFRQVIPAASARPGDLVSALVDARHCPEFASTPRRHVRRNRPTIR